MNKPAENGAACQPDVVDTAADAPNIQLPANACHVTTADQAISTVLGSCIAVCVRDPETGVGGMNHFMLPYAAEPALAGTPAALRYGPNAMDALVGALRAAGARPDRLEAKVFGGGQVLASLSQSRIGAANIEFVFDDLAARAMPIVAHDVGGRWPRRVVFRPATGQTRVRRLPLRSADGFDRATGAFIAQRVPGTPDAASRPL